MFGLLYLFYMLCRIYISSFYYLIYLLCKTHTNYLLFWSGSGGVGGLLLFLN